MPVLLGLALGLMLLEAASAGAISTFPASHAPLGRSNPARELTFNRLGNGVAGLYGFIPVENAPPIDLSKGYPPPTDTPPTDFETHNFADGWIGTLIGRPTDGSPDLTLYCIDILTETNTGYGYGLGTWDESNVPNVGYVAQLLHDYFPANSAQPAALSDVNQRAAAVQLAIWFFTDGFVMNASSGSNPVLRPVVANIVDTIIAKGPLESPPPPSLTITPSVIGGPHRVLGPFRVNTDQPTATVSANGATMYRNPAGTDLLGNGSTATVTNDTDIWLRSSPGSSAVLTATAKATVPTGNVYLYDGLSAPTAAQKLILANTAELTTNVRATATFQPFGSLVVRKTIAGPAAGHQGQVVIHVDCDDGVTRSDFVIPAGTPAGSTRRVYRHIVAGTSCTVMETSNGSVVGTDAGVTGDGQEVTIPPGGRASVHITDTYNATPIPPPGPGGSLLITKTVAGPRAGDQGPVTIHTVCNGTALADFVIAARTPAGSVSHIFDGIPAGSVCTVTETLDGSTARVFANVSGDGQTVMVPAGEVVPVSLMDVYDDGSPAADTSGTLTVTKHIAGSAARRHGRIAILVACGGPLNTFSFIIPAHTGPGSVTRHFDNIPAGSRCHVTETADGHTNTVAVAASGNHAVTIPATGNVTVQLTDRFTPIVKAVAPTFTG